MSTLEYPAVAKVAAALREAGMDRAADGIRILDADVKTAAAAAAALGVEVGAIANSLIFRTDSGPLLALTSGAHRADTKLLAELVGVREVGRADATYVREHTGQPIGGVAPTGHPAPLRTLVDRHLERHAVVWAAAGHPKSLFPTTFAELVTLTGGTAADVAREEDDRAS
ncbi:Cys-tRNA(Pro) deacylase, prolyl-tRNA editing enzyme YbaK/EbsC [Actinokineospora alba]|uniref:Cys-tRNA(Pro) deacylase, prolyl-tRNA editing enzyme YbaK/EbsC n=1 Tax=Actinokineospora alba TaxID=504798 RepID=A0A1H0JJP1_9PSEU|nr:YbaK/EbsC family protein [Actinokineospora alba]TDP68264.1 prolyl-tRNA editing enzyme YbaK/EbsC (Cys-tRNA(Pro) deacylase) [Actinokineospora alba]SDH95457.1 Cys-tRNA(Pro) deacylase, prolyl-tRNA editing enzyme YbaK/EbsC [Actinokineospora alba]SDO44015.1 Cys-tRNA(Pro) deacylase, prolyl-tRNA editing enzyme YbaK/EbsC [Actinokineospora alba]